MSLVNDLLIELDRQKAEEANDRSFFLDGMRPGPRQAKASTRLASTLAILTTLLFIGAGLAFVAFDLHTRANPSLEARASVSAAPRPDLAPLEPIPAHAIEKAPTDPTPLPSVAPSTVATTSTPAPASTLGPTTRRIERVTRLSTIALEPRARFTRLRLGGDAGLSAVVDQSVSGRRLIIHLPKTRFEAPLEGLDLDRTLVAAFTTRDADDGVSFELELDRAVRVRTQERTTADAAMILIDLTPAQADSSNDPLASRPSDAGRSTARLEEAQVPTPTSGQAGIERSASDRLRRDRERSRAQADESLTQARLALQEGRAEDVDRLTLEALAHLPDHREAVIARAEFLASLERGDEALALVHEARRASRTDPALTMLHARLLEANGRRDDAIRVLSQSGLDVARAPELHAMAAVLLQRDAAHNEAIERFEAIVRRHPGEARWWMGLGISLEAMSRTQEAIDVYRIAMDLGELGRSSREWVSARISNLENEGS